MVPGARVQGVEIPNLFARIVKISSASPVSLRTTDNPLHLRSFVMIVKRRFDLCRSHKPPIAALRQQKLV